LHWLVYVIAAAIVIGLATYAGYLFYLINQQTLAQEQQRKALEAADKKRKQTVVNSIQIICRSVAQQQCDISEASWRVSVLMDSLNDVFIEHSKEYPAVFELYNGIKHMPILDNRKKLTKKERMKFDLERMKLEAHLNEAVLDDLQRLAARADKLLESLI
jgi:Flp pilus assembly protein CpaB